MENEETKQTPSEAKPVNIVDEARAIRDEIRAEREKLEAANEEAKQIKAESMLSGTAGGHVDPVVVPETAKDYADKVMSGKVKND